MASTRTDRPRAKTRQGSDKQPRRKAAPRQPKNSVGNFTPHRDGYGFVAVEEGPDHFIPSAHVGGALDGDRVNVAPLPPRHGKPPASQIIGIAERRAKTVRGQVFADGADYWVAPLNSRLPEIFVEQLPGAPEFKPGDWVVLEFTAYPEDRHTAPNGRIVEIIEDGDSPEGITGMILRELDVPVDFDPETHAEVARIPQEIPSGSPPEREDLTHLNFITIDGEDARDFDDAVTLETLKDGGQKLTVAIADVAHYVVPGSSLDADAYRKGTSAYFPTRVEPMLPERLSNDLCSLKPGEPRLVLVCEMTFGKAAQSRGYRLFSGLIRSRARITYTQVQQLFDTGEGLGIRSAKTRKMLQSMRKLAEKLRDLREARGALNFVFPEARFVFGSDGSPSNILKSFPTDATRLIEQFMLEANETVARHCEAKKIPILYRVHDPPPADAQVTLREQLWNFGLSAGKGDAGGAKWFGELLAQAESHPDRDRIEMLLLRAMSQACYRHTNDGHFGLAATHYAHFTSPIRRYPDLLLHRALKAHLEAKNAHRKAKYPPAPPLPEAGEALSERERLATDAERQVKQLFKVMLMEPRIGEIFEGVVSGVNRNGLFVELAEPFVDGFLPISQLLDDHYRYDPRENALKGARRRNRIGLGAALTVQLVRCDKLAREIEFALPQGPPSGKSPKGRRP